MKYIVWYLISPYDGYSQTVCDTWEAALEIMKIELGERLYKEYLKSLKKNGTGKVEWGDETYRQEAFITSQILKQPI